MRNSILASLAFAVAAIVAPGRADAQGMTESQPVKLWLGGHLGVSPIGTQKTEALGLSTSVDTATAFELGGRAEFQVTPLVTIGFAPSILLGVKAKGADRASSELDLPLRLALGGPIAPRIRLYGFAAPGFSIGFPPSGTGDAPHATGFLIGFGGGVGVRVAPRFSLHGELGYQFRFLSETDRVAGQSIDVSGQLDYLTFTIAAVAGL